MTSSYLQPYVFIALLAGTALVMAVLPLMLARLVAPRKPGPSKRAAYECGMEPSGDSWIPFRIEYYVYALLFVVFDVEIAFMLPWALIWRGMGLIALVEMGLFILILAIGLAYAWRKGVLEWK